MDCDILVIGCGAAGLSAAGYGARAGRSVIAIDALAPGGQLLYIDEIENYPGTAATSGYALAEAFEKQAVSFGASIDYLKAESIRKEDGLFLVGTQNGDIRAKAVIYAAGDLSLLDGQRITLTGMPKPSFQGRSDAAAAVSYFIEHDAAVLTTLDDGIPSLAVSMLLKGGGKPIAVLSGPLSKCASTLDAQLQGRVFASGLLLSVFPPSQKLERWLVMIRNSFIASISGSVLLAEEKDGGPSWSVFDKVLAAGGRAMLSASMLSVPSYTWARQRAESGALTYSSGRDLRRLLPKAALADDVPDLFS